VVKAKQEMADRLAKAKAELAKLSAVSWRYVLK
jgi:hypothetical protein